MKQSWPAAELVDREGFIIERTFGKKVLDLGCADWPFTHERPEGALLHSRIRAGAAMVVGGDYSQEGLTYLAGQGQDAAHPSLAGLIRLDATRLPFRSDAFDVVVFAEIIEHLRNPIGALCHASRVLKPGGELLITTPSAHSVLHFAAAAVTGTERIHPDHYVLYSATSLNKAIADAGLQVKAWHVYIGEFNSTILRWRGTQWALRNMIRRRPFLAPGLIAVASPI